MTPMRVALAACSLVALSLAAPALAQEAKAPLSAEAMWKLQRLGTPSLSPDGRTAVVPVTRYDMAKDKGMTDLYLIPTDGRGAARQLTTDAASDSQASWSPDGKNIIFVSKRGDDEAAQLYVIAPDGGEARRLTTIPTGAASPKWFADSNRVAFISAVWPDLATPEAQAARLKERKEAKVKARVWEEGPIAYWDHLLDDTENHLWITDLSGSAPVSPTLGSGQPLDLREPSDDGYDIAPDGAEITYSAETDRSGIESNYDLYVVPTAGGKARNITADNKADDGSPRYSPDGRYFAYTRNLIPGAPDRNRVVVLERKPSSKERTLGADFDRSASDLTWAPDSSGLFAVMNDRAQNRIFRYDLTGANPKPISNTYDYGSLSVAGGVLVALRQSFSQPNDLVSVNLTNGEPTQLSRFNDAALAAADMGKVESVTYAGANGAPIQMWVVKPPNFDPNKKYPVFLILHGGPHSGISNAWTYRWNAQVFAGWGYVVAWHNFHGSSGFGDAFTDSINPDWTTKPYADTIKAAEWFKAQPYVDGDRMVAGGGSYGGYLASVLLGREHPFKALIAHAAVYNLYTQVAADGWIQKARFYEYWEKPKDFQAISPHMFAANFKTPTLVIHGQNDLRVPVNHGVELFQTLQKRGVPSKYVYFPDENHWILKGQNSLFWYDQVKDWLARYAAPGPR